MEKKIYSAFLAIIFIVFSSNIGISAQINKVEDTEFVHLNSGTLASVMDQIGKQKQINFAYNTNEIDIAKHINFINSELGLNKALNHISSQHDLSFKQVGDVIYVKPVHQQPENTSIQNVKIKGIVKDNSGQSLIGATVLVKETGKGTVTDIDGNFTLDISDKAQTLVVSYIGYATKSINIGSQVTFEIVLEEDISTLGEVVVTAFSIERSENELGYAAQKVSGDKLDKVKGVDVATSLTGKVSGLLIKNSTEFAEAPDIQLRGETPLLVIDGVPYGNITLRDIPADNIESISVLKGATASALYGYRGASGAIMVTTKKGADQNGLSITLNSSTMFSAGFLAIPEQQTTYGREVNTDDNTYISGGGGAWGPPMEGQIVNQWNPQTMEYEPMPFIARGANNFENFLEQGYIINNSLSVTQQGEKGSIRSSVAWVQNKGQYANSVYDKVTYSIGGEIKMDKFSLSSSMAYNSQKSPNIGFSGYTAYDPMYNLLVWSAPDYDIRQYKNYWMLEDEVQNHSYRATNNNPYFDRYERTHGIDRSVFNGTLGLKYDINSWLDISMRTGLDNYNDQQIVTISKGSYVSAGTAKVLQGGGEIWGESQNGSYNMGLGRGYSINNDLLVTAKRNFGNIMIDAFVGGTLFFKRDEGIESMTSGGLTIPGFYSLKSSLNNVKTNSVLYKQQVNSVFGRMAVSYKNLFFLEGTLRNDWSSTLPESTRSYAYPSVSANFAPSELLNTGEWLSSWNIRGSFATSKTPPGIYTTNSVYEITNNAWDNLSAATYPTTMRGMDVKAESADTYEVGTLISFLGKRASLDATYYSKRMYDFLRQAGLSPSTGYYNTYVNSSEEITRRGVELTANFTPVISDNFRWDVGLNWSKYARYYTQLDSEYSQDVPWVKVGERVDHFTLQDFLKDSEGNIIHNNGLPQYSPYQSVYGYSDPDAIWGINTTLQYKNFRLGISADGRIGGLAQATTEIYMWQSGNHPDSQTEERYLDATNPGTANYIGKGVKVVSGEATYDTYGNILSDTRKYSPNDVKVGYASYVQTIHKGTAWGGSPSAYDAYDATFFKIREVSLGYNVPKSFTSKFGAQNCSLSLIGQNVFYWAKEFRYSDIDGGSENFSDPSIRYLGFNVDLTF
ncbi:SusC/RagA family TonB-linked outer membrane protein [Marivirga lumbricoides]|uniref:SusC/RagA family TonB-linked outer membrane protein n=2 Tax=Marivirga lumbricoides TaxID=1046115 RepID=A0ABQ1N5K8_9BACT|nr:SusC/RagA family TonB-linked outer membrane protein [Marivirga lumbricoides]